MLLEKEEFGFTSRKKNEMGVLSNTEIQIFMINMLSTEIQSVI